MNKVSTNCGLTNYNHLLHSNEIFLDLYYPQNEQMQRLSEQNNMLNLNVIRDLQFMQLSLQREKPRHITIRNLKQEIYKLKVKVEAPNSLTWMIFHLIKNCGNQK